MNSISLNGTWCYRIGNGATGSIEVPFSKLPVGKSVCRRSFDVPDGWQRLFLKFDGITYYAQVFLNDRLLGEMLPYCEYEFEISDIVEPAGNELTVVLEDIDRAFGPSEGWENFGGIIRDVHLLCRSEHYIENVFFKGTPTREHSAVMEVEIDAQYPEGARFLISLHDGERQICSYVQDAGKAAVVPVEDIALWTLEEPKLYTLAVELFVGDKATDRYVCAVGFRAIGNDGRRFLLNGKPLFLKGVCKHEMVNDSGHCPTPEQMEGDMRMIKEMGCNFVRLVHYPHNKRILDIADRIGLLVSEEPGLWWSDTADPEVAEGSKEVLRRTILRDRNHACIAFWLCFNECKFTERFLQESAALCRQCDPTRMVSGANCMSDEDTLVYYNKCGFDFYTMHPYAQTFDRAQKSAELLNDKPLLFTEWGGFYLYDNPHLMQDFMEKMHALYLQRALAGASFWFFAELNDFNRGRPACIDGVLREGLVTKDRTPTLIYDSFCRGLKLFDEPAEQPVSPFWYEEGEAFESLPQERLLRSAAEPSEEALRAVLREQTARYGVMRKRNLTFGPKLPWQTPYLITPGEPLLFAGCADARRLTVLGLTSAANGYPLGGAYGEEVCRMKLEYEDGSAQEIVLKNGVHITTVFALHRSSRIDPVAESAPRFALFGYDRNFEVYIVNRLDVPLEQGKKLRQLRFTAENDRYAAMVYGVFAGE